MDSTIQVLSGLGYAAEEVTVNGLAETASPDGKVVGFIGRYKWPLGIGGTAIVGLGLWLFLRRRRAVASPGVGDWILHFKDGTKATMKKPGSTRHYDAVQRGFGVELRRRGKKRRKTLHAWHKRRRAKKSKR